LASGSSTFDREIQMSVEANPNQWRRCSSCKAPIVFGASYYVCNVSTCTRGGSKGFVFCAVSCWDAHLGIVRHRESWAVDARAPSREEFERSRTDAPRTVPVRTSEAAAKREVRRRIPQPRSAQPAPNDPHGDLPRETLIVMSKLKQYVKAKAGFNCSDRVAGPLSNAVRRLCDQAIANALADDRKTLLDRDFER
jgi:hypothetical protein